MNCFEKLREYIRLECEPCIWNAKIIEFEQLPEHLKYEADYYDDDKDLIIYCQKCNFYGTIEGD